MHTTQSLWRLGLQLGQGVLGLVIDKLRLCHTLAHRSSRRATYQHNSSLVPARQLTFHL